MASSASASAGPSARRARSRAAASRRPRACTRVRPPPCRSPPAAPRCGRGCWPPAPRRPAPPRSPPACRTEVPPDRVVEQVGFLRDDADRLAQRLELDLPDVVPVDLDRALLHVVETRYEVRHGGLPGAGRPDERRELTRPDLEIDVLQRPLPWDGSSSAAAGAGETGTPPAAPRIGTTRRGAARVRGRRGPSRPARRRSRAAGRGTRRSGRTARARTAPPSRPAASSRSGRTAAIGAW